MLAARYRSAAVALSGAVAIVAALSACGNSNPAPAPTVTVTTNPSSASSSSSTGTVAATPPPMVGVTRGGALVTLNPATGTVSSTLVSAHVIGDEVSVAGNGMVYFAVKNGCKDEVEAIPVAGGGVVDFGPGSEPAVSPDGSKLAYADQPTLAAGCVPQVSDFTSLYHLVIRTLSSGSSIKLPMLAPGQSAGLPYPISHLSWAADNVHVAVSISAPQDNEGWQVTLVDTAQAQYYLSGTGVVSVPVTGSPTPQQSYLREGVYMPNGNLFISRACCGGFPIRNTSRLMWEVGTSGAFVHQVAIGFPNLDHVSLDVSSDGNWLLYLAANDLYVSDGGAAPRKITSGLVAAAWG